MDRKALWKNMDDNRRKVLPAAVRTMAGALSKAIQPVRDSIETFSDPASLAERAPSLISRKAIEAGYEELYKGVMPKFAALRYRQLKKSVDPTYQTKQTETEELEDLWIRQAVRYVRDDLPYRVTGVTKTTEDRIRSIIQKGIDEGLSIPDIGRQLDELGLEQVIYNRSQVVARTEVINASNRGDMMGARASKLDLRKEWLSTPDDRTRGDHRAADEQTQELNAPFEVGGEELDHPGDPAGSAGNVINCRCTQVFEVKE